VLRDGIPENYDGSSTSDRIYLGQLRSSFEGDYTLRLKSTGTNDNGLFTLENGNLYFTGSDSGDFEDYANNWTSYDPSDRYSHLTIEVEYLSGQTVFYTESYDIGLSDINVPVTATETAPNEFRVTTPETGEEIHITNLSYTGMSLVYTGIPTWHAEYARTHDDAERITLTGPDADKFHLYVTGGYATRTPISVESRAGLDFEAFGSAAGTNTYTFSIESTIRATIDYEVIVTDLEGALDPQMNDI
jgi:hypothetical protein